MLVWLAIACHRFQKLGLHVVSSMLGWQVATDVDLGVSIQSTEKSSLDAKPGGELMFVACTILISYITHLVFVRTLDKVSGC